MAINPKRMLGKTPLELGDKDAVHVAIVSVRAGRLLRPGQRCTLNDRREAVPCEDKGHGIVDPWLKNNVTTGESFWMVMNPDTVDRVAHTWEHQLDFSPPTVEVQKNTYLEGYANKLGITYKQLMDACEAAVNEEQILFPGNKTELEVERISTTYSANGQAKPDTSSRTKGPSAAQNTTTRTRCSFSNNSLCP